MLLEPLFDKFCDLVFDDNFCRGLNIYNVSHPYPNKMCITFRSSTDCHEIIEKAIQNYLKEKHFQSFSLRYKMSTTSFGLALYETTVLLVASELKI